MGVPVYKALQTRWKHWDDLENDPRWNADSFQFSPTSPHITRALPVNANNKLQYNRLSNCGSVNSSLRSDSFRNHCRLPRVEDQVEIKMPPAYRDLYTPGSDQEELCNTDPAPAAAPPGKKTFKKFKKPNTEDSATSAKQAAAVSPLASTPASAPVPASAPASDPTPASTMSAPVAPPKKTYKKIKKIPATPVSVEEKKEEN